MAKSDKSIWKYVCWELLLLVCAFALFLVYRQVRYVVCMKESMEDTRELMLQALEEAESVDIWLSYASGEDDLHTFSQEEWSKLKPHLETVQCTIAPWLPWEWGSPGQDAGADLSILFHYPKGKGVKGFGGFLFVSDGEDCFLLRESEAKKLTHWRGERYIFYLPDADYAAFYAAIPPQLLEAARSKEPEQK